MQDVKREKVLTTQEKNRAYKANKFYDDHMAGKFNKQEGEFNFQLGGSRKMPLAPIAGMVQCRTCKNEVTLQTTTASFICNKCNTFNITND